MHRPRACFIRSFSSAALLWCLIAGSAAAAELSPELERALARRGTHADTALILHLSDPLDQQAFKIEGRHLRDNRLLRALKERLASNRARVAPVLAELGASRVQDLWLINALAVTLPAFAVKRLQGDAAVARIELDSLVQGARSQRMPVARSAMPLQDQPLAAAPPDTATLLAAPVEWNLQAIHARDVWALGYSGQGVTVASMDTGVDLTHPALRGSWRGGTNSWFDPHGEEASPFDATGHGTQTLGLVLGAGGVGVAPGARWIAARLYDSAGRASMSDIHRVFQWLLDPDGDPATLDAPDVVNASWSLTGRASGSCLLEFDEDIRTLQNAGIAVVFAAGNDGPGPRTSNSPGNNPGVLSVGAADRDLQISRTTSRGPSACDGAAFPRLLAPGVGVYTIDVSHGGAASYTTVSGSSMAAPHASGVLALLAGAFAQASVAQLQQALVASAHNGGTLDALAAWQALRALNMNRNPGERKP